MDLAGVVVRPLRLDHGERRRAAMGMEGRRKPRGSLGHSSRSSGIRLEWIDRDWGQGVLIDRTSTLWGNLLLLCFFRFPHSGGFKFVLKRACVASMIARICGVLVTPCLRSTLGFLSIVRR